MARGSSADANSRRGSVTSRGNRDIGTSSQPMRSPKDSGQRSKSTKESRPAPGDTKYRGYPETPSDAMRRARSSSPSRGSSRAKYGSRSVDPAEMRRFYHSATRVGRRTAPGEQGIPHGCKRGGYDHAASRHRNDMLMMPDHQQQHPVARKEERRPDCFKGGCSAGVESERLCILNSGDLGKVKHKAKPVYYAVANTDPITHREFPDEEENRDFGMIMGSAGVRTDRLTYLGSCQLTTHPALAKANIKQQRTDPISHIGGYYEEPLKKGIKPFAHKGVSNIPTSHTAAPYPKCDADKTLWLKKNREVHAGGEVLYNVAGHEDLLPPATQECLKSDWPASDEYREFLDRKWLPSCFRVNGNNTNKLGNKGLMGSEDMYHAMHGEADGRRRHAMDKEAFKQSHITDEPNYGVNWPLLHIERGGWSQTDGHPQVRDAPLRWPANVAPGHPGASGSMTARPPNFRSPNGLSDWGGLGSLDMWHTVPHSARQTTPMKSASSDRMGRATPVGRPASTPAAGNIRGQQPGREPGRFVTSPRGEREPRFANSPRFDRGSDRTRGIPADATLQMDMTRERGADFSRAEAEGYAMSRGFTSPRQKAVSPYAPSPMVAVETWE